MFACQIELALNLYRHLEIGPFNLAHYWRILIGVPRPDDKGNGKSKRQGGDDKETDKGGN